MANLYDAPSAAVTASGVSLAFSAVPLRALEVNVNVTAVSGTTPTLDVYLEGQDNNGVWYVIWHPTQITAIGDTSQSVGPGCQTNIALPDTMRLRWVIGGTATPTFTMSISVDSAPYS